MGTYCAPSTELAALPPPGHLFSPLPPKAWIVALPSHIKKLRFVAELGFKPREPFCYEAKGSRERQFKNGPEGRERPGRGDGGLLSGPHPLAVQQALGGGGDTGGHFAGAQRLALPWRQPSLTTPPTPTPASQKGLSLWLLTPHLQLGRTSPSRSFSLAITLAVEQTLIVISLPKIAAPLESRRDGNYHSSLSGDFLQK